MRTVLGIICLLFLILAMVNFVDIVLLDDLLAPDPIQPYAKQGDGGTLIRYSFVPHYSLLSGGVSWYDRVVEEYTFFDYHTLSDKFILTRRVMYRYHYPLFGLGEPDIEEVVLFGTKVEFVDG